MGKKTRYKKLIILANALVPAGAVMEDAIFKDKNKMHELTNIIKEDSTSTMYSIWYPLNKADSQGCFVDDSTVLENAAIDFMKNGEKSIKILHNGELTESAVVKELWIVKKGDPLFTDASLVGSLAGGIKFFDQELYSKMQTERWETSIEGVAEEEEVAKSWLETIEKTIKNCFKIFDKNETTVEKIMTPDEIKAICIETIMPIMQQLKDELMPKNEEVVIEEACANPNDELKKELEEVKASLKKELSKSIQGKEQTQIVEKNIYRGVLGTYNLKIKE